MNPGNLRAISKKLNYTVMGCSAYFLSLLQVITTYNILVIKNWINSQEDSPVATEHNHIRTLVDKLKALPPERIAEVEDFIDFLNSRIPDRHLTQAASQTAESSFAQVWDNPDDAIYDQL